jgi:hypothetical protein
MREKRLVKTRLVRGYQKHKIKNTEIHSSLAVVVR